MSIHSTEACFRSRIGSCFDWLEGHWAGLYLGEEMCTYPLSHTHTSYYTLHDAHTYTLSCMQTLSHILRSYTLLHPRSLARSLTPTHAHTYTPCLAGTYLLQYWRIDIWCIGTSYDTRRKSASAAAGTGANTAPLRTTTCGAFAPPHAR